MTKISDCQRYIFLTTNNNIMVKIEMAKINLCLAKNERMVIEKRAIPVIKAPIRNGLIAAKVNTVVP